MDNFQAEDKIKAKTKGKEKRILCSIILPISFLFSFFLLMAILFFHIICLSFLGFLGFLTIEAQADTSSLVSSSLISAPSSAPISAPTPNSPPSSSPSPLLNVPLDSWIYSELARLEAMNLLAGVGASRVALYSKPLTRQEVAILINQALLNVQKKDIILKETEKICLEKLVMEFKEELKKLGIRVLPKITSTADIISNFQAEQAVQYLAYFMEEGYIRKQDIAYPISRIQLAEMVSQIIFLLLNDGLKEEQLSHKQIEYLDYLVTEFKDELSFYGIQVVYLNKRKALVNHFKEHFTVSGSIKQSLHLVSEEDWTLHSRRAQGEKEDRDRKLNQGLYQLEFCSILSGEIWEEVPFLIDLSLHTDIYNIYNWYNFDNLQFSPLQLRLNKAYLKFKTPSYQLSLLEHIPIFSLFDEFEIPEIIWQIGRDELYWGPAYTGSLILSNNTPALDMIAYSGNIDLEQLVGSWGDIHFLKFFSLLDHQRLLFGQRFEYCPDTPWRIALSETAIADAHCGIGYYSPIPFPLSSYLIQQIYANFPELSDRENDINYNIGFDLQYNMGNGTRIYGEFLFDDFIFYKKRNLFPDRMGFTIGSNISNLFADKAGLLLEYTRINNYVYFPRKEWQNYLYKEEYLGHPLGPDADQLTIQLDYQLAENKTIQIAYIQERHGEGQHGVPLPADPDIANQNRFLSGIIEKTNQLRTSFTYDFADDWQFSITGSYTNTINQDNKLDENINKITFSAEIKYVF